MRSVFVNRVLRAVLAGAMTILFTLVTVTACSEPTRFRVLSFFLDGVPEPGSKETLDPGKEVEGTPEVAVATPRPMTRYFAHTPYRENRCAGCHSAETGQLVRSIEDGLCLNCHRKLVSDLRFQHGPVAVNDCTTCHHHHTAPFPKLLLQKPVDTCLNCHDKDDLAEGDYHADVATKNCIDCHNPHGGDDKFFLRPGRNKP